jgi:hypothetical protein
VNYITLSCKHSLYHTPLPLPLLREECATRGVKWKASVPEYVFQIHSTLTYNVQVRTAVTLNETLSEGESRFRNYINEAIRDDEWLSLHPPQVIYLYLFTI